jgi:hypothetical protein
MHQVSGLPPLFFIGLGKVSKIVSAYSLKGEIPEVHKPFSFPYAIYHTKDEGSKTCDTDSLPPKSSHRKNCKYSDPRRTYRNAFSIAMTCYRAVKMAHGNRYLKPFLLVFNTILDGIPPPWYFNHSKIYSRFAAGYHLLSCG